jgi:hypothetical protein
MYKKNNLVFSLAVCLILVSPDMHAQIKSGYIIGFNISNMNLKTSGTSFEAETMTGIHVGVISEIPLKGNFILQSGIVFSAKGSIYKIDTTDVVISPIYVEVPFNARYSIGSDFVKVFLFAGPYIACGVGGNKDTGGELKKIKFGADENDDLKFFDFGFYFGAGVNIKGFVISAQYGLGLANISPATSVYSEMKNKVIGISLSSYFTGD